MERTFFYSEDEVRIYDSGKRQTVTPRLYNEK